MITFGASLIEIAAHGDLKRGDWARESQVNSQFGANGITVLDGGVQSRSLSAEVWIYATDTLTTRALLETQLRGIDSLINRSEVLDLNGEDYGRCRFDGLQIRWGPKYSAHLRSWLAIGDIVFTQLRPPTV